MELRPYQTKCLSRVQEGLAAGCYQQLVKMATGTGKTVVFSHLPDQLGWKKRVMVILHRDELAVQAMETLARTNPARSVGIEMGDRRSKGADMVVAGVQSLGLSGSDRIRRFDPADFDGFIVDEAHHATASTYQNVFKHFGLLEDDNSRLLLGVTATPNRADGNGLNKVFKKIVYEYSILDGIDDGWLADLRGKRIQTDISLDNVRNVAGDFNQGELADEVNTYRRNILVADNWAREARDRKTIMFGVDIAHCKGMAEVFRGQGIRAEAVWGDDPERKEKLARHKAGQSQVLFNAQLLTEGYDDWEVAAIGLTAPTQSESKYVQMVGRGTRIPPGIGNLKEALARGLAVLKKDCLVLDYVDNCTKHSLITLPSLYGMGDITDLKGRKLSEVAKEVAQAAQEHPEIDLTKLKDLESLPSMIEQVNLFRVTFPPEVVQISELQWHRTGIDQYILLLTNEESVSIKRDLLDNWNVVGSCQGAVISGTKDSFEEAVREADWYVNMLGGKGMKTLLKRTAKWHNEEITPAQRTMCKWLKIPVPAGMTKGQAHQKINEAKAKKVKVA